ncbi:MAG: 30S ribosomal protein S5 [Clostridia bacterium]|nr:30S ribosomal protein S5 [Clostridia bacterium]
MAKVERTKKEAPEKKDEFEKVTVDIRRVTKVVKGGRNMRFSALVVTGDGKGKVGVGMGRGAEVSIAMDKAGIDAKKHIIEVPLKDTTIPHEVIGKFEKTKVIMMPAKRGNGIIAGGSVRSVVELVGIKDITTKMYGSNNPVNCVKATLNGLQQLRSAEQIAKLRGKNVDEIL